MEQKNSAKLGALIVVVLVTVSCLLGGLAGWSFSEHTQYLDKENALYRGMWSTCAIERLADDCDAYVKNFQDREFFQIK